MTLVQSALRAAAHEDGEPLEGVSWNDELPPRVLAQLKRMAIFEAIAGRSDYLTYSLDEADGRLFLVQGDDVRPIIPDPGLRNLDRAAHTLCRSGRAARAPDP